MITKDKARSIIQQMLLESSAEGGPQLAILDDQTIEREFGWVFFYTTKAMIETGDPRQGLVGNAPFIVRRSDGSVFATSTAYPIDFHIKSFSRHGTVYPPRFRGYRV